MSTPATVKVYRTGAKKLAKKNKAGNSVEAISFPAERKRLNRAIALEREHHSVSNCVVLTTMPPEDGAGYLKCDKVLSVAAKAVITQMVQKGAYEDREDRREPPFMAPSVDPEEYSSVCLSSYSMDC